MKLTTTIKSFQTSGQRLFQIVILEGHGLFVTDGTAGLRDVLNAFDVTVVTIGRFKRIQKYE